jgi:hypothetical protein
MSQASFTNCLLKGAMLAKSCVLCRQPIAGAGNAPSSFVLY